MFFFGFVHKRKFRGEISLKLISVFGVASRPDAGDRQIIYGHDGPHCGQRKNNSGREKQFSTSDCPKLFLTGTSLRAHSAAPVRAWPSLAPPVHSRGLWPNREFFFRKFRSVPFEQNDGPQRESSAEKMRFLQYKYYTVCLQQFRERRASAEESSGRVPGKQGVQQRQRLGFCQQTMPRVREEGR